MNDRQLPDEALHDLLHELADLQEAMNNLLTRIYTHIELEMIHQNTVKKMIDKKGSSFLDIIQVMLVFILLIVPFLYAQLWWWVWFWVVVLGAFGVFELLAWIFTKKTLSQQFGKFRREHKVAGIWITISLITGWLVLIWHLWS